MELSAEDFRKLFTEGGSKVTAKGRPVIDLLGLYGSTDIIKKGNRKVMNATPVHDAQGNKLADSKWEYRCKNTMEDAGLKFEFQKKFLLLPTTRQQGMRTLKKRTWAPDFVFEDHQIVADAKGHITEMARIKIQLFLYLYPGWKVYLIITPSDLFTFINQIKQIKHGENS